MAVVEEKANTAGTEMDRSRRILFRDAEAAIRSVNALFAGRPADLEAFERMTQYLLHSQRRFVLYLGAGCSKQVLVEETAGAEKHAGKNWVELLDALLKALPPTKHQAFLDALSKRAGVDLSKQELGEAFKYFDKLTVAWFLTSQFHNKRERDQVIESIVEPPRNAARSCALLEQLNKFPFRDVITTNYDSNIARFFKREGDPLPEVTSKKDLFEVLDGNERPRLFYLHGKVGHPTLIFDRFDYQQLLAERDGILDYVTFLLRNSHVLYVGFGLDDPSFNLMETRLSSSFDVQERPESFALLQHVTEVERKAWEDRGLRLIDYGEHESLASLFQYLNEILDFVSYAEPERPPNTNPLKNRTGGYIKQAAMHYVSGEFKESILTYRKALGSTIFWGRDSNGDYKDPLQAELVCDILIRMAQSHYKLRWSYRPELDEEDHAERMDGNLKDATRILNQRGASAFGEHARVALENSRNVLNARIKYHEGRYSEARRIYSNVVEQTKAYVVKLEVDQSTIDPWNLKIAEASYYSQCQISRIEYQVRSSQCTWRSDQINVLHDVQEKIRVFSKRIAESKTAFNNEEEREHCVSSFATILRIAQWTEGRLRIAFFMDLLPVKTERSLDAAKELSIGISLLQPDPWLQLSESIPSCKKRDNWDAPARWLAMKFRYEARAHALKWLVNSENGVSQDSSDLIAAYACIQSAMRQTAGRNLERQWILNVLEAARLSILIMFGERVIPGPRLRAVRSTPFSRSVGLHYLNEAFGMIERIKTPLNDQWHSVLAHRVASYFSLVAAPLQDAELRGITNETLRAFLGQSPEQLKEDVVKRYTKFADDSDEHDLLDERIGAYKRTFDFVQKEIQGSRPRHKCGTSKTNGSKSKNRSDEELK